MKISTTALWHNKKILAWLPKFGTTPTSVWVEWGAWLLEIVVRRRTQLAPDVCLGCGATYNRPESTGCGLCGTPRGVAPAGKA